MRADVIAFSDEGNSYDDSENIDNLNGNEQNIAAQESVSQKQRAGCEPNHPGRNADALGAFFCPQMMYLRIISDSNKHCSNPADDFHFSIETIMLSFFRPRRITFIYCFNAGF